MGGKSQKQTTQQKTEPWAPAQGALQNVLNQAGGLYNRGSEYAPFSTVVPFSWQTESALSGIENRANAGNPLYGQGRQGLADLLSGGGNLSSLRDTAAGNYLDVTHSPLWGSMTGGIQDAVNSQFSAAGRTGSPAHAGVMTSELGRLAGQLWGQERQNQLGASQMLGNFAQNAIGAIPGYQEAGYNDLNKLLGVGAAREAKGGETLQDLINRWNFGQQSPWDNLMKYAQVATGVGGMGSQGTSTTTTQQPSNILGSLLGVGSSLAGLATGNPFAALGLLGGSAGKF